VRRRLFTGLIQDVGKIQSIDHRDGGIRLTLSTQLNLNAVKIGDSISVEGVCLTVVNLSSHTLTVEVSPETLRRTTLSAAKEGQAVNLETALKMSDPMGGHLVAGHVDGTGEIVAAVTEGNSTRYRFRVPREIGRFLIEKGSVAVDGISLTVMECQEEEFSASVIPHTAQTTTLGKKKAGDRVNLENDLIAKYVEKFVRQRDDPARGTSRIDSAFLARHGFTE
jgi:riboflavin synthase